MSAPVVPSPLDSLRGRRFLVIPSLDRGQPNDWRLGFQTWGDIQIVNFQTGREVWIPRSYVAGLCAGPDDMVPAVALKEPLRLRDGLVVHEHARVLQMPFDLGQTVEKAERLRRTNAGHAEVMQICSAKQVWAQTRTGRIMWAATATALVPAIVYALLLS